MTEKCFGNGGYIYSNRSKPMPMYEYECKSCKFRFDEMHTISNRENPTKKPCPKCSENSIEQGFFTAPVGGYDASLKPHPAFGEIINSVKHGGAVPKRYHENLDRAVNRTGARYNTQ
tara:strand:- start:15 stop:365 length:351 start_codon:yes stop_codon:yes gene_type:complete